MLERTPVKIVSWALAAASLAAPAAAQDPCSAVTVPEVLAQVNAARARGALCGARGGMAGAAALVWNERLAHIAREQAVWLAERGALQHAGRHGETLAQRATAAGYDYAHIAENLAQGQTSLRQVLAAWTASEGHCVNLYDSGVSEMALACVPGPGGRPVWALALGRRL